MIPGSNLLDMAFSIIASQSVSYTPFISRAVNTVGLTVATYGPAQIIPGSLQPVSRSLYANNGLDFQKQYYTFYASINLLDIARDVSGDQFTYNGKKYQVISTNDWYAADGWVGVLCVIVGAA